MLDKHWIPVFPPHQQPRYQPVHYFTYCPLLVSFNKCNVIKFSHKATTSDAFEEIYQVFPDIIRNNMAFLVQYGKYGAVNTTNSKKMAYYVIKFVLESCTIEEDTTWDLKNITAGEIVVKAYYLSYTKEKNKWYFKQKKQKRVILFPTRTIVHSCLDVFLVKDVYDISRSVLNRKSSKTGFTNTSYTSN